MTEPSEETLAPPPRARREARNISASPNYDLLAGVSLRVSVAVGATSMPLSELLTISEGSVIELDRANGTLIAKGEIVSVDGRYGIKVAELVAPERGLAGAERRA